MTGEFVLGQGIAMWLWAMLICWGRKDFATWQNGMVMSALVSAILLLAWELTQGPLCPAT